MTLLLALPFQPIPDPFPLVCGFVRLANENSLLPASETEELSSVQGQISSMLFKKIKVSPRRRRSVSELLSILPPHVTTQQEAHNGEQLEYAASSKLLFIYT